MIVECTIGRDAEVEVLVFNTSAETEVDLWQTATENSLVVSIDNTVVVDILIEAVTHVGSRLRHWIAFLIHTVVEVSLCACDSFIYPSVELTNLLAHLCLIGACDIRLCTEAE